MSEYETRLDIADYIIVQDTDDYGFSQDSVILANLADIGKNDVVLDIGCGTGILSTLAIVKKALRAQSALTYKNTLAIWRAKACKSTDCKINCK